MKEKKTPVANEATFLKDQEKNLIKRRKDKTNKNKIKHISMVQSRSPIAAVSERASVSYARQGEDHAL